MKSVLKSVMLSIQPYWVFLIIARIMGWEISKEKTIEVRKDYPKDKTWNRITHIYCSKDRKSFNRIPKQYQPFMKKLLGKVIGEFVCDKVEKYSTSWLDGEDRLNETACLDDDDIMDYMNGYTDRIFYAWRISDLKIYDKPRELGEFRNIKGEPIKRPFQSWGYVEGL